MHQECVCCLWFQPYNVWILLKTVIKYLHWSICKTMLYHGKAATCRCMYIISTIVGCPVYDWILTPLNFHPWGLNSTGCDQNSTVFSCWIATPETGGHCITTTRRIKFGPPVELWPRVFIPRWIMTPGLNSTLNCDPDTWFNVQLWLWNWITIQFGTMTRVIIQREILTRGHNSTLNCDPGS